MTDGQGGDIHKAAKSASQGVGDRIADLRRLSSLELDAENPRFGGSGGRTASQREVLDHIVKNYGVQDVLSSLAVNGYFKAEPLVGRAIQGSDKVVIVEGNRRLAACLMLADDDRASNQLKASDAARKLWAERGLPAIDPVPVIVFQPDEKKRELLSYLGVRHISASAPWDSYAKAAWVARVVEASELSVSDVAQMVGDQHRTVARLLEGYYFIKQVETAGVFKPTDSVRSGRGSVTEYPFSWVYTILGYAAARQFLGLNDEGPKPDPVPAAHVGGAGLICQAMFGNRSKGISAAVSDSRDLGDLASVLASPEKVALLEQGMTVEAIVHNSRPLEERLRRGLAEVRAIQQQISSGLAEQPVTIDVAAAHLEGATINRRTALAIENTLRSTVTTPDD